MNLIKSLLVGAMAVSVCVAQSINISGKVTDTGVTPLPNAAVSLENAGLTATTDANGNFTFTSVGVRGQKDQLLCNKTSAAIHNGLLWVNVQEKSNVEITTFTLQGQAVSRVQKTMEAGNNSLALPNFGAGVYLFKVRTGEKEFLIKNHSFDRVSGGTAASVQSSSSNALAKQAKSAAAINDVIAVTATGYLNYRVIVTNSDTSGIQIKMIVCAGTVKDTNGNVYQAVKIGNQIWTVENLRTTKFNEGSAIPLYSKGLISADGYCYYGNTTDAAKRKKFGALYTMSVVSSNKLAPVGWHVPTVAEWDTLQNYLIANGYNYDGTTTGNKIAKSLAAKTDWGTSATAGAVGNDLRANDRTGFSVLPAGFRDSSGGFTGQAANGNGACWMWSSGSASPGISFNNAFLTPVSPYLGVGLANCGFSVRLVKDPLSGYTLSGAVIPDCAGSLTLSPNQASYTQGQVVTVTFTPGNLGFALANWLGDASGSANPLTVKMDGNKSITAIATHTAPVLSGPATSTGAFTLTWTFAWPGLNSTSDYLEIEESTTSTSSGFSMIYQPLSDKTSQSVTRAAGTYYYRIRAFMASCGYSTPYSSVVTVTVSGSVGTTVTLAPTADALLMYSSLDNTVADTNYGTYYLNVGNTWDRCYSGAVGHDINCDSYQESALQFALPLDLIGKTIVSAELKLYTYDVPPDAHLDVYTVAAYAASWSETGITYNHEPDQYNANQSSVYGPATNDMYTSFDVTSIVRMWVNQTNGWVNNGFHIWDNNYSLDGSSTDRAAIYYCREKGGAYLKPQLIITYQ